MLLLLFAASLVLELGLYTIRPFWHLRKIIVFTLVLIVGFTTGGLAMSQRNLLGPIIFIVGLFRIFNYLRIIEARMHPHYLRRVTSRTGSICLASQLAVVGTTQLLMHWQVRSLYWWLLVACSQALAATFVLGITVYNIRQTCHVPTTDELQDRDTPTVTVAIPARNETADLAACLESVLASNYPKLEVLVLDDCSQDRTPEIIRSFAHDGVRFVHGQPPSERWLAKNQAYDKLAQEASGDYVVFCGVDVRFGPNTIRNLINTMQVRQKRMISILPQRREGTALNAIIQPARYWWELAIPRILVNRPAVLSSCWIIERQALEDLGGMPAVSHAIIPEGYFARELIKTNSYSFLRSDNTIDIQTNKQPREQRATAIRLLYPQIRRRPEVALSLTLIDLLFLLGPFFVLASAWILEMSSIVWLASLACLCLIATHTLIVRVSDPGNTIVALINFPVAVIAELALGLLSMWKYEFSTVDWKGRNICIPVMHSIPKLPSLDQSAPVVTLDSAQK
ncbi:MAG: hypothetical protein NVS1B7_7080 [Candidatus Saccharimonadales bacterium]